VRRSRGCRAACSLTVTGASRVPIAHASVALPLPAHTLVVDRLESNLRSASPCRALYHWLLSQVRTAATADKQSTRYPFSGRHRFFISLLQFIFGLACVCTEKKKTCEFVGRLGRASWLLGRLIDGQLWMRQRCSISQHLRCATGRGGTVAGAAICVRVSVFGSCSPVRGQTGSKCHRLLTASNSLAAVQSRFVSCPLTPPVG
jgi:hypothetical protein